MGSMCCLNRKEFKMESNNNNATNNNTNNFIGL